MEGNKTMNGKVYLVGAGPGDPELLTIKGKRLLSQAEVLVYDRLASPEFVKLVPDTCEKIYVGKVPGHHSMKQEEINQVLVKYGLMGKKVVRLKGGDPFVFGRGGEEILELEKYSIPYEVISGVTSPVAALAHAGIPITHRGIGQSFHVITGHTAIKDKGVGGQNQEEDTLTDGFAEYAKLQGTLVFLMGLKNLELIVERLIKHGKDPETPSAVVTDGTLKTMRCVRSRLADLPQVVRAHGLKSPGIIVVGPVAEFEMTSEKRGPLDGVTVGITGTTSMFEKLSSKLALYGASTPHIGNSRIVPCNEGELQEHLTHLSEYQWITFTSRNAIELFFQTVRTLEMDHRTFAAVKFAAVGTGTAEYLKSYGFCADYVPETFTTEALAKGLCQIVGKNERILIPRARQGSKILTEYLDQAGISYKDLPIYDVEVTPAELDELKGLDYISFESGSGVRGFFASDVEEKAKLLNESIWPVCIGHVTADVLKQFGVMRALIAKDYTSDGICEVLI